MMVIGMIMESFLFYFTLCSLSSSLLYFYEVPHLELLKLQVFACRQQDVYLIILRRKKIIEKKEGTSRVPKESSRKRFGNKTRRQQSSLGEGSHSQTDGLLL